MKGTDDMNEWITDLLALQDLDMKIRNLKLRIDTIPAEKKRLNSLVKDAMDDVEVAKDGLRRSERNINTVSFRIVRIRWNEINMIDSQLIKISSHIKGRSTLCSH